MVEFAKRLNAMVFVFEATSAGPFMLARLPDGDYTISADNHGRVTTKRVRVDQAKHQKVVFEWNA
jgi:hypothetical protein